MDRGTHDDIKRAVEFVKLSTNIGDNREIKGINKRINQLEHKIKVMTGERNYKFYL